MVENSMTKKLYDDSTMLEFQAKVIDCIAEDDYYWIVLDQTAFYVESGGMSSDTGTLNDQPVLELKKEGEIVYHKVKQPLTGIVIGIIETKQRRIKTQIHTAQHLLSALLKSHYGAETTSHHVLSEGADVEVSLETITKEQLLFVQDEANKIINEDHMVFIEYPNQDDLTWRVVRIGKIDSDPCGCLHVSSTSEIKNILITGFHKVKKGIRIEYLAGDQILEMLAEKIPVLDELSKELSLPHLELVDGVKKLKQQQKEVNTKLMKRTEQYLNQMVEKTIKDLDLSEVQYIIQEYPDLEIKELQILAASYTKHPNIVVILETKIEEAGYLIISKNKEVNSFQSNQLLDQFKTEYHYRGGGNEMTAQGNGEYIENLREAVENKL